MLLPCLPTQLASLEFFSLPSCRQATLLSRAGKGKRCELVQAQAERLGVARTQMRRFGAPRTLEALEVTLTEPSARVPKRVAADVVPALAAQAPEKQAQGAPAPERKPEADGLPRTATAANPTKCASEH